MDNKQLCATAQKILKEQGHDISLGHLYELFSKLAGANSWNVAKAKGLMLSDVLQTSQVETVAAGFDPNQKLFDVKLRGRDFEELTKYYRVSAKDEAQARKILEEYQQLRDGDIEEADLKFEQTKALALKEDEWEYKSKNWEVTDAGWNSDIKVEEIYEVTGKEKEGALRSYAYTAEVNARMEAFYKAQARADAALKTLKP